MRKSGKKIKHSSVVMPLGVKKPKYELSARAALIAIKHDCFNDQHLADLYVLSEICEKLGDEAHISKHAEYVKRMCEIAHGAGRLSLNDYISLEVSANVLIDYFSRSSNVEIARVTTDWMGRLAA